MGGVGRSVIPLEGSEHDLPMQGERRGSEEEGHATVGLINFHLVLKKE